jgi:hypothetical protein
MSDRNEWVGSAFVGIGLAGMALFGALAAASAVMGPASIPIWGMAVLIVVFGLKSPLGKAFAERLSGRAGDHAALPPELFAELDDLRNRLAELEERQDFTERILARHNEPLPLAASERQQER